MTNNRFMQLKFITNIFQYSLQEIKDTLGYEALTMIFRRVGERVGTAIAERLKGKYSSVEDYCNQVITTVIEPVVGEGKAKATVSGNKISFVLDACPYKKAGFPIKDMGFFCDYTEGLLETAIQAAFPDKTFTMDIPVDLISKEGCSKCVFDILQS